MLYVGGRFASLIEILVSMFDVSTSRFTGPLSSEKLYTIKLHRTESTSTYKHIIGTQFILYFMLFNKRITLDVGREVHI